MLLKCQRGLVNMKKIVRNLFIVSCLTGSALPEVASASTDIDPKNSKNELTEADTYVAEVIKISNGKPEKIPIMQYEQEKRESNTKPKVATIQNKNSEFIAEMATLFANRKEYKREKEYYFYMPSQRASATIDCPVNLNGCDVTKTYTITQTETWDLGGGLDIKYVKLNAGYHWAESLANASAYTFKLKPGQRGFIGFEAKKFYTSGLVNTYSDIWGNLISSNRVSGSTPVAIPNTSELDGVITLRLER